MSDGVPPLHISPIRAGGAKEVLEIGRINIEAGAERPFTVLFAADTHLNFWDVTDFCGNPEREEFFGRRWVRFPQALNSLYATIDYAASGGMPLIHGGDLLDWNTRANIEVATRAMRGVDWLFAMGNHEYHSSAGAVPLSTSRQRRKASHQISASLRGDVSSESFREK